MDVSAVHLRKGMFFNPDPYIKLWLQPADDAAAAAGESYRGHQQHTSVCENTTQPSWSHQVFAFRARLTDVLKMKLKDKFVSSRPTLNRFLGLVTVPVRSLLETGQSSQPVKFAVTGRSPSDHVSGYLYFTVEVLKGAAAPEPRATSASSLDSSDTSSSSYDRHASVSESSRSVGQRGRVGARQPQPPPLPLRATAGGRLGELRPLSEQGYESDSSGDESVASTAGDAAVHAAMQTAESASDVGDATTSRFDARPLQPPAGSYRSRRSSSSASSSSSSEADDSLDTGHNELNRVINSSSVVPKDYWSLSTDASTLSAAMFDDAEWQRSSNSELPHRGAAAAAQTAIDDRGTDHGRTVGLGRDTHAAADAKRMRHTLLSGSLSLATVHHGQLTPVLMRSSSPRPACSGMVDDSLPAGWEARIDVHGRTFYIDHLNRKTTWVHPGMASLPPPGNGSSCNGSGGGAGALVRRVPSLSHEQIRQMDERYSIVRRLTMKELSSTRAAESLLPSVAAATAAAPSAAAHSLAEQTAEAPGPATEASPVRRSRDTPEVPALVAAAAEGGRLSSLPTLLVHVVNDDRQPSLVDESYQRQLDRASVAAATEEASVSAEPDYMHVPVVHSRPVTPIDDAPPLGDSEHPPSRTATAIGGDNDDATLAQAQSSAVGSASAAVGAAAVPAESPPAVRLLLRDDFFSLVQYNDDCQKEFLRNVALKHMVHRIRKNPETFAKYMHNRDLVAFLNKFAERSRELPGRWEMKLDKHRKPFFVDHASRSTSYIDPRLPADPPVVSLPMPVPLPHGRHRRSADDSASLATEASTAAAAVGPTEAATAAISGSNAPVAAAHEADERLLGVGDLNADLVPLAYDAKVVAFLRQDGIMDILHERSPALHKNESLKRHIAAIVVEGAVALQRYRNNMDLTMLLSLFEPDIMAFVPSGLLARSDDLPGTAGIATTHAPGKHHHIPTQQSDFQEKYRLFHHKLHSKGYGTGTGKIRMRIRRDHLLQDTYNRIMACSKRDLHKSKLLISFEGEAGLDYGGPAREFFFLFSREIFNPYYGLFEYSANDMYTVQISPVSQFVDLASEWFRFAGRMLGLCIVHQYLMDCYFTRPFYKMLLKQPWDLTDLESLDAEFHQSLLWIRDNDITGSGLDLTFSVDEEVFGQVTEHELKPGGRSLAVSEKNKSEYIERMLHWRIERGIAEQKESLLRGFHEVIDPKHIAIFDAKELELVIAGSAEIDVADWRANTEYRSGYYDGHPVIANYWRCIERFDNEQRLRLLQFVTGTSSIPFEGFVALRGSNGPRKFTIEQWGEPQSLPRAHTCFNRLDLPPYKCLETMMDKLRVAIEETSTFGVE